MGNQPNSETDPNPSSPLSNIGDLISSTMSTSTTKLASTLSQAGDSLLQFRSGAGDTLSQAGDSLLQLGSGASDTLSQAGDSLLQLRSGAGDTLSQAGDSFLQLRSGAGDTLSQAGDSLLQLGSGAGDTLSQAGDSFLQLRSGAGDTLSQAGDSLLQLSSGAGDTFSQASVVLPGNALVKVGDMLIRTDTGLFVSGAIEDFGEKIKEASGNLKQTVGSFLVDTNEKVVENDKVSHEEEPENQIETPPVGVDEGWSHADLDDPNWGTVGDSDPLNGLVGLTESDDHLFVDSLAPYRQRIIKVFLIGDASVGKTSLLSSLTKSSFSPLYCPTLGIDFDTKKISLNGKELTMQIWDIAGKQDQFLNSIGTDIFCGAHGGILVFDWTNAASFQSLDLRRMDFLEKVSPGNPVEFPFLVIGNKSDEPEVEVSIESVTTWCQEKGIVGHFSTSAKLHSNIVEAFEAMAKAAQDYDMKNNKSLI